nr:immunoglobulin heavy chain junction region [Mus musculus]
CARGDSNYGLWDYW